MKFQSIQDALGFGRSKYFIETSRRMGIELVLDDYNLLGLWKMDIHQIAHTVSPIHFGASFRYFDVTPVLQRCKEHEQVGHTFTSIFIVVLFQLSRYHAQRLASFTYQLFRTFVEADQGTFRVDGSFVDI